MANIQYPPSLGNDMRQNGQHCVLFDSYETKTALATIGSPISSIALFIPPNSLQTTHSQNFEGLSGAQTIARSASAVMNLTARTATMSDVIQTGQSALEMGTKLLAKTQPVQDILAASAGLALNNHTALVYRGPGEFRTHSFNFSFAAKNEDESNTIREIIDDFETGSNPSLVNLYGSTSKITAPFFKSPRQYKIKFLMNNSSGSDGSSNPYLFEIKTSVITQMVLNFDPNSVVSLHSNGAPVNVQLQLTFKEIEYRTNETVLQSNIRSGNRSVTSPNG